MPTKSYIVPYQKYHLSLAINARNGRITPKPDEQSSISRARDAGTGGGAVGATCPHNFEAVGAPPPTLDCESRSFLFLFVFARELRSLPKIVGQIREVLGRGYLWTPGDVRPQLQSSSRAPVSCRHLVPEATSDNDPLYTIFHVHWQVSLQATSLRVYNCMCPH